MQGQIRCYADNGLVVVTILRKGQGVKGELDIVKPGSISELCRRSISRDRDGD